MNISRALELLGAAPGGKAYVDVFGKQADHFKWERDRLVKDYLVFVKDNCGEWFENCYPGVKSLQAKKKLQTAMNKLVSIEEVVADVGGAGVIKQLVANIKGEVAKLRAGAKSVVANSSSVDSGSDSESELDDEEEGNSGSGEDVTCAGVDWKQWMLDTIEHERNEKLVLLKSMKECEKRVKDLEAELEGIRENHKHLKLNFLELLKEDWDKTRVIDALGGIIFLP